MDVLPFPEILLIEAASFSSILIWDRIPWLLPPLRRYSALIIINCWWISDVMSSLSSSTSSPVLLEEIASFLDDEDLFTLWFGSEGGMFEKKIRGSQGWCFHIGRENEISYLHPLRVILPWIIIVATLFQGFSTPWWGLLSIHFFVKFIKCSNCMTIEVFTKRVAVSFNDFPLPPGQLQLSLNLISLLTKTTRNKSIFRNLRGWWACPGFFLPFDILILDCFCE